MSAHVTSNPTCPSCGAEVPPDAPRGYCLKCLFALGTAASETVVMESTDKSAIRNPKSEIGSRSFGDYELLEEIARGGMGIIHKARQKSLGRIVAVKMLLFGDQSGKELAQRFRAEAAAAASLQHPNIVAIHEVGAHEGQPFFAMEFIDGQSLAKMNAECEVRNAEWLRRAARYVKIVAESIHYAHERGILHRDLKPSNVLIDPFDQPRVTDFGLAKRLHHDSELTLSGQVLGSANYMPPEQAAAKRGLVGRRSDVYSLGAILYHLLTGRPPFVGETLTDTLHSVLNTEPVSPRLLNPSVPRDLETLCLKCLEKEPARRYATAQALAEDLSRFLRDEPIHARPLSETEKIGRWCRRKPAVASLGTATVVLLLAVGIGLPVAIFRINHERQVAQQGKIESRIRELSAEQRFHVLIRTNFDRMLQESMDRQRIKLRSGTQNLTPEIQDLPGWEKYQNDALYKLCQKSNAIFSLSLLPDGKSLAIGEGDEGKLSIWDLQDRKEITRFPAHIGPVFAEFSPRGRLLAFSSGLPTPTDQSRVRIWDADTQRIVVELALENSCRGLAFSSDGQTLATLSSGNLGIGQEGELTLWKVREGTRLVRHPAGRILSNRGRPFAIAPDLSMAAHAAGTGGIRVMNLQTGQEQWSTNLPGEMVTTLAVSPDGKTLASAGDSAPARIRLWDLATGQMIGESSAAESQPGHVCSLVFSPDGKTLVSGGSDHLIRLWEVATAPPELRLRRRLLGHKAEVWSLAVLPGNRKLVSGGKDGSVMVWNM